MFEQLAIALLFSVAVISAVFTFFDKYKFITHKSRQETDSVIVKRETKQGRQVLVAKLNSQKVAFKSKSKQSDYLFKHTADIIPISH